MIGWILLGGSAAVAAGFGAYRRNKARARGRVLAALRSWGAPQTPLEIIARAGLKWRSSVYTALDQLEDEGLVHSWRDTGTPARGMIPRRFYSLTPKGVERAH